MTIISVFQILIVIPIYLLQIFLIWDKDLSEKTREHGLLKHLPTSFKSKLLILFNQCIFKNRFPSDWKKSQVTMIPKKADDKSNIKNYRPISITSSIAKLNERLIKNRLYKFIESNNLLVKFQSGFRKHRQTKDNIF